MTLLEIRKVTIFKLAKIFVNIKGFDSVFKIIVHTYTKWYFNFQRCGAWLLSMGEFQCVTDIPTSRLQLGRGAKGIMMLSANNPSKRFVAAMVSSYVKTKFYQVYLSE